jgi:hypothetical protein
VRKLIKGDKPVKVGVVGGSITFLENDVTARGWWAKFARFLTLGFPHATIVAKNGAVPGTPSGYALMCLELMVEPDVDIVFIGGRRGPGRWPECWCCSTLGLQGAVGGWVLLCQAGIAGLLRAGCLAHSLGRWRAGRQADHARCADARAPPPAVEYILNDGFEDKILDNRIGKIYERLVRKIMKLPSKPAVVMMQVGLVEGDQGAVTHRCHAGSTTLPHQLPSCPGLPSCPASPAALC